MKDKVLIDTSVWIAYFKGKDSTLSEKMDKALSSMDICVPRIVMAELIQGAKSEKEISVIEGFLDAFNIIDQREDTWLKAGRLSFLLKKKGISVHLTDCYIAEIALEKECTIFTLDKHFWEIRRFSKILLIE